MADQPEILEHHADPPPKRGQAGARHLGQFLAEQADPAAGRALREVEQFEQRGLARARRPGEEIEAPADEPEIQVAEHLAPGAVAEPNAVEFRNLKQASVLSPGRLSRRWPPPCQADRIPVYRALTVPEEGFLPI